jgi:Ricin-type beta-trefoil lectin domain
VRSGASPTAWPSPSGNFADFAASSDIGSFCDDESESLSLSNVPAGTIIRIYDANSGSTARDWTQILVKQAANQCLTGGFENSVNGPTFKIDYHDGAGDLNDEVSLVVLRSALIDFAGRCVDVVTSNNAVQMFGCHGNTNQSFIYENGAIRGFNNLCLEANPSQISTWPSLPAGTPRSAGVRMANCNNSFNQSWTVTESGQIRMFADMCLDIVGGSSGDQAALQIFPCHGNANQRWLSSF